MDIIIPCAGTSSRFPKMRPKYLLADYRSQRMIELAAAPYLGKHTVHAVILEQHEQQHGVSQTFKDIFGDSVNIVTLPNPTSGPAETVYECLKKLDPDPTSGFMIHYCDSMFECDVTTGANSIFVDNINNHYQFRTSADKAYVNVNDRDMVTRITESKIIGDLFCVGGYQFSSKYTYMRAFDDLRLSVANEVLMSTMIDHLIDMGEYFTVAKVSKSVEFATAEDWERWNDRPTIFCDIDGTLVHNQSPYGINSYESEPVILKNNVDAMLAAQARGCQIIFTTGRSYKWITATMKMLDDLGFNKDYRLLMDLHHARRILINDYAPTNPYPSAVAINIKRDDDCLDQLMKNQSHYF